MERQVTPDGGMPSFARRLSRAQINAIAKHVVRRKHDDNPAGPGNVDIAVRAHLIVESLRGVDSILGRA